MPGLSIILPAGDDVSRFEDTLAAVLRNRPRACEVIVPHAGAYADPYELASEVWFIELAASATREECLAHAVDKAAGDVIHVLSPGCEFDDAWWQPAVAQFADPSVGCVAPVVLTEPQGERAVLGVRYGLAGRSEIVAPAKLDQRAAEKLKILGPTYRAGFYRRTALKQIGGWPTSLPHSLADVDVALSMKQLGYRAAAAPQARILCPSAAGEASPYQIARQREQLFWRHLTASAAPLAIFSHPLRVLGECVTAGGPSAMLATIAGKFSSLADLSACSAHAARLQGLQRLTVVRPPPKSGGCHAGHEDRPRRAA